MSLERAAAHLAQFGLEDRIKLFDVSSATVELAALAVGCEPARIAKSLSFMVDGAPILILAAGDAKIDNAKYKAQFHTKAAMLPFDDVETLIGHGVGGVCPFGANENVKVYLDISLQRFEIVYPAAGTAASAVELNLEELERSSNSLDWIDVCKAWQKNS